MGKLTARDFKKGDTVFVVSRHVIFNLKGLNDVFFRVEKWTVTSVGRKYVTAISNPRPGWPTETVRFKETTDNSAFLDCVVDRPRFRLFQTKQMARQMKTVWTKRERKRLQEAKGM